SIRIFCYPQEVFPPTDFHTATLVDARIIVIGCLGYPQSRQSGRTPVYYLDVKTMRISELPTWGDAPGWISRHKTKLSNRDLVVTDGEVWVETTEGFDIVSNSNRFALNLDSLIWTKLD
nr:ankyrin repeat domain-containing protein [Gammaproteobacteria bacterium]